MFNEAGWTVVTRKSRNRQHGSRRLGCSGKRGMLVGSLWDDDNDMIFGQVADDRTKEGMVKISAIVEKLWTEEDDETLQLGYLGSVSCLMSSP